jgi:hypothetical protein
MKPRECPILEFDRSPHAVIEASCHIDPADVPEHCVPCFFNDVITKLENDGRIREVACMRSEMGRHPLHEIDIDGGDDVSGTEWDHRNWHKRTHTREDLVWLAAEACLKL